MVRPIGMALLLIAVLAPPAWGDFAAGARAYKAGDYETARREWRPLAEQGDAAAQHGLGTLYQYGFAVAEDSAVAAKWYRAAAEQGHANAQAKLAYLLGRGKGLPTDYAAAARWFREAAEQGHAEAQFNLGILYAMGAGVERDRVQALMWLILADSAGVEAARERRRQIAAELSRQDVEEAEILADALRPVDAPPAPPSSKPSPVTSVSASLPAAWASRKAPPQRAPASTAGSGGFMIHLASYRTPEAAVSGWRRLRKAYANLLGKLDHSIVAVELGEQGTFYRLQAGPLKNRDEAEALCAQLKRHDLYCAPAF